MKIAWDYSKYRLKEQNRVSRNRLTTIIQQNISGKVFLWQQPQKLVLRACVQAFF